MKIKFKTRHIYRENVMISASPEADALFELLKPRQSLRPNELTWVAKMGFEIEIVGDVQELGKELKGKDLPHIKERGEIKIKL